MLTQQSAIEKVTRPMDKTAMAIAVFDKNAKNYKDKFMDQGLYENSFDLFCEAIDNQSASILDVACGPGNITKYLLDRHPGYNMLGIDLAPTMLVFAKVNNPSACFQLLDCREIGTLGEKFDGIMCGFCLPYLSKEEAKAFIATAATMLTPHGVLYISTMEDDYAKSGIKYSSSGDVIFMHYHQADYLLDALATNCFSLLHIIRQAYPNEQAKEATDLILIAKLNP